MKLLVISSAPLIPSSNGWKAYGPYVKEMEIWAKYADEVQFCCPIWESDRKLLVAEISFETEKTIELIEFDVKSLRALFKSVYSIFANLFFIARAMKEANHVHFRCPGNIGLLGCVVQMFFPSKIKTAKYAGNWDPKASQPLSYRLQKWILSNTFLTRNMQVLVYGEWEGSTKNIKPFFTATYTESDKKEIKPRDFSDKIRFLFVGTLSEGKQPLYALQLFHQLVLEHDKMTFDIYGEGLERKSIEEYIKIHQLENKVTLHGNQNRELIENAYQNSHFLILPSKSEGWPKVVAEAMFWGCVPVTTAVSCVPYMVENGARGILLSGSKEKDVQNINEVINSPSDYAEIGLKAMHWSQQYTLDYFEEEIRKLLNDSSSNEHQSAS